MNQWTQLVATWDGETTSASVRLFVNGLEISAYPQGCTGSIASDASYAITIGATYYNANSTIGTIDNVRVYNRPLTATEVSTLYNSR